MNLNNQTAEQMDPHLHTMLKSMCEAQISKAKMTLKLLSNSPAGIGDHSTKDFYENADEALTKLAEAQDKLECLDRNYQVNNL
jgi:hypothetical protein